MVVVRYREEENGQIYEYSFGGRTDSEAKEMVKRIFELMNE